MASVGSSGSQVIVGGSTPFVSTPNGTSAAEKTIGTGLAAMGIVVSVTWAEELDTTRKQQMMALE
jgi:glucose uptake protein GlcU